jgi:predicted RND superfamily exporter protein
VVNRFEEEAEGGGEAPELALRTARAMRLPVVIAGVTTVVGFAALLLTDVPAVFEIGAFSILGVASVTLSSAAGVPAALALLPVREGGRRERFALARRLGIGLAGLLDRLARLSVTRSGALVLLWGIVTLTAIAWIPRIVIDTDYLSFFDADDPVRRDFAAINRLLSGAVPLFVVLSADEAGAFREPSLLRQVEALQARIDALPGVGRSLSFVEPLRLLNRAVEGGDPAQERLPDTRAGITELVFMLPKADLMRFATIDQSAVNLMVRSGEVGSAALRRLTGRIEAAIEEADLPAAIRADVTGNAVLLSRAADGVAEGQPRTVGFAALTIFVLLSIGLRSLRLGLVAMIPNIVPVLIFFGALGVGAAPLSLPTSLIGAIALGIAIDATAHYVIRYRSERLAGCSPEEAVRNTTASVGRPVLIAAAMLTVGFLSVALSEFATLRQFGVLTAFTMVVCALADLTLLPALLIRLRL